MSARVAIFPANRETFFVRVPFGVPARSGFVRVSSLFGFRSGSPGRARRVAPSRSGTRLQQLEAAHARALAPVRACMHDVRALSVRHARMLRRWFGSARRVELKLPLSGTSRPIANFLAIVNPAPARIYANTDRIREEILQPGA